MAQSNETAGYYIKKVKWNDPRFAPHDIRNLGELNDAQNEAFLDLDNDDDFGPDELTKEELIAACKQSECRVDLSRANVCKGVERSWPKLLFGVNHFDQLESKQQKVINRTMEKYGTKLYTKYVDENRMAKRKEHARRNSHAYIYEQRYRKNLYNRIKALGDPNATQTSHETHSMLSTTSMETVNNAGETASQNSSDDTDENENECFTGNVVGDLDVAANEDYENDSEDDRLACATPVLDVEYGVEPGTPNYNAIQQDANSVFEAYDTDASEEDN